MFIRSQYNFDQSRTSMEKEISKYKCYEEYLDSLVIEDDQKYLGDIETARQLVQLGYR